jgi:hypothetical protein
MEMFTTPIKEELKHVMRLDKGGIYCPATRLRRRRAKHGQVVGAVLVLAVYPAH